MPTKPKQPAGDKPRKPLKKHKPGFRPTTEEGYRNLIKERIVAYSMPTLSGCWEAQRGLHPTGYSTISYKGKTVNTHRVSYLVHVGPIEPGLEIDHLCRNRCCCNPDHLEAVTKTENNRRGFSPTAIHARQTHCIRGHEFTKENTYYSKSRGRTCRACQYLMARKYVQERAGSVKEEAPTSANRKKEFCPLGHPYSGENLITGRSGYRFCRTCHRAADKAYKAKRKALGFPTCGKARK